MIGLVYLAASLGHSKYIIAGAVIRMEYGSNGGLLEIADSSSSSDLYLAPTIEHYDSERISSEYSITQLEYLRNCIWEMLDGNDVPEVDTRTRNTESQYFENEIHTLNGALEKMNRLG